ncbi:unnamed protein product [Leptidea sinapis]|uniref:Uncharacterized protein n=1 Tax=Leptidea sinapis TaxID=189913 RepID=A0A5E4Q856_9NEOP|nr:unnamed protein product [Leptidea sinapis]
MRWWNEILVTFQANAGKDQNLGRRTIDGMILKTLWSKVLNNYDVKTKEMAMKQIKASPDYDKLVISLTKVKKEKVQKIIDLKPVRIAHLITKDAAQI